MQMLANPVGPPLVNQTWCDAIFTAKAAAKGGVVRRAARDVDREIGRDTFVGEVRKRGYHLVEIGGQYVVICSAGHMNVIC